MSSESRDTRCDLLVVGGGPAGLSAAGVAARCSLRTVLVDERASLGGQIYRQPGRGFRITKARLLGRDHARGAQLRADTAASGAELRSGTTVLSLRGTTAVCLAAGGETTTLAARRVLISPGAHDRPVVFPGWDLPGVITAGGAQALVKASRVSPGDRVAFVGSGPLALAFPAQLHHYGVNVVLALEAGPAPRPADVVALLAAGRGNTELLADGLRYRAQLVRARVPLRYGRIIVRAEGDARVEEIVHSAVDHEWRPIAGSEERLAVNTVCVGYGFVPSAELFRLLGCAFVDDDDLGGPVVVVDEWQRTTVEGISAAGDGTGVRGAPVAKAQGRLAAIGLARDLGALSTTDAERLAAPQRRLLAGKERFRRALLRLYGVGEGIYELATPETVVCRCEEVVHGDLERAVRSSADVNVIKSYTRAGMGLCQGRNCSRHIAALVARRSGVPLKDVPGATARPPVRPVPLGALADDTIRDAGLFTRG